MILAGKELLLVSAAYRRPNQSFGIVLVFEQLIAKANDQYLRAE